MQAITTKYIGPSNVKGSRVKALAYSGSITLSWDSSLNTDQNHKVAAYALATKYGWTGRWVGGELPAGSGNAYVCVDGAYGDEFTIEEAELRPGP